MNPSKPVINLSGIPPKPANANPTNSYEELKKLAAAKAVQSPHPPITQSATKVEPVAKVDIRSIIMQVEADAINKKFGHLGVGDYDKLLVEKVQEHISFVPSIDKDIHALVVASVKRYAAYTEKK